MNFIKCPFCAGHEVVSPEAAETIADMIQVWIDNDGDPTGEDPTGELMNIRNAILNGQERREQNPGEVVPLCPTPKKRRYFSKDHTIHDATQWRQYAYLCDCGWWHLSKQRPEEHAVKINSPVAGADEFPGIDPLLT
jgi:hypothetical protein